MVPTHMLQSAHMEDASNSPYKVIEGKVRFHRKRAEFHRQRAAEWDRVLAQIQALQREEQPRGRQQGADVLTDDDELGDGINATDADLELARAKAAASARAAAEVEGRFRRQGKRKVKLDRARFARELLEEHAKDGILPVEIRRRANEAGFSTPTNYPYKILTHMVENRTARKDPSSGRYYPASPKGRTKVPEL